MKIKKILCLILAVAMLPLTIPAVAAGETITYGDVLYVTVGENLFKSPNFGDGTRREAPQWYVGANTGTTWDGKVPNPVTGTNLTPLENVVQPSETAANGKQAFYYSSGGALTATGSDYFLCEYITNANGSFWNGNRALLSYVPIEPGKTYYFSYNVSSWGNTANSSVRYGAINSDSYCSESGDISWSGSGGESVGSFNGNNMTQRGSWAKYDGLITAGDDADYFFFNLYWLQDTNFVCLNGFTLVEVEPAKVESFEECAVRTYVGTTPPLPSYLNVTFEGGAAGRARVRWDDFNETTDGEYTVNGTAYVGSDEYPVIATVTVYSDSIDPDYSISREIISKDGEITARFGVYSNKDDKLSAGLALFDSEGALSSVAVNTLIPTEDSAAEITVPAPIYEGYTAKTFLWNSSSLAPLIISNSQAITVAEGGQFMPLSDVTLLDGIFLTAREVNEDYLMAIEPDRLLAPVLESAGMEAKAQRYGGWETAGYNGWGDKSISGHSLGHWMSAISTASVESQRYGDELKARLDYAVSELARVQEETGSGYIGGLNPQPFEQAFAGTVNTPDGFNLNGGWVPWYSVHKIYQGLIDAYDIAGNTQALEVVKKFADWAVDGIDGMTDDQVQKMLNVEYGGMNDVFAQLYKITANERYLTAAVRFTHNAILDPLAAGRDELTGKHANTQIPKIVGAAAVYEQDESLVDYKNASEFFWNTVVNNRSFVIGGNSVSEHFEAEGAETLHIKDAETCNTFNMIKLTEHLYSWDHKAEYMDYVENALYNDILGSQDPETGNKMYFTSMLPGHFRIYGTPDNSWWCCTGSGMENPGRYSKVIYYKDADSLFVNLYIPSQVRWRETGLTFRTETNFPYSENVTITVADGENNAALKLRVPSWTKGMSVKLNGEDIDARAEDGYITIDRLWTKGDTIEITLPMTLSVYTARDNENKVAFKYGPIVLAAPLGDELAGFDIRKEDTRVSELGLPSNTVAVPNLITESDDPSDIITAVDLSTLTFSIDGWYTSDGRTLTLMPFYEIHHQFHNVYWYINAQADPRTEFERALNEITIDSVTPDGQQEEMGHGLSHKDSHNGTISNTSYFWRDAYGSADAYFSYDMAVDGDAPNYLYVCYWGSDGNFQTYTRSFDILVDGVKLASQTLNKENPDNPYDVFYEIPEEYTTGKDKITVKFAVQSASTCAGGVLDVRTTSGKLNID